MRNGSNSGSAAIGMRVPRRLWPWGCDTAAAAGGREVGEDLDAEEDLSKVYR